MRASSQKISPRAKNASRGLNQVHLTASNCNFEINVEFLAVTGPLIQQVKRHELTVIEAPPRQ